MTDKPATPNPDLDDLADLFAEIDEQSAAEDAAVGAVSEKADPAPPLDVDVQAVAEVWADMDERLAAEDAERTSVENDGTQE
jgi:hypothetical protein